MRTVLLQISAPSGCERLVVVPVLGKYLGVGCVGCVVMVVVPVLRKPGLGCVVVVAVPVLGKCHGAGCVVVVVVPVLRKPGLGCVVVVAVPVLGKCHGVGCVVMVVVPVLRNPGLGCGCPCDWWISGCVCVSWMDDAGGGRIGEILGCVGMKRWVGVAGRATRSGTLRLARCCDPQPMISSEPS